MDLLGITPVSDRFLQALLFVVKVLLLGETELGSAGTQPDKG
jgi:hypothetical protein